jgi:hopanoid biosynthesis associated RND transporter like protein HpnN
MNAEPDQAKEATLVQRLLVGLVTVVCHCPRLVLAVAALLSALSLYVFCTRLEYRTQRTDLVNSNKDYQRRWQQYLAEFGNDEDMVVVVEGADRDRMKAALEALAAGVRAQPERFDRLFYKVDLRHLHPRALLYLPADQIAQIQENLNSMRPLLEMGPMGWEMFTLDRLVHEAGQRLERLRPDQPLSPSDQQFFTQFLAISRAAAATLLDPAQYRNPWRSLVTPPPGQEADQQDMLAEPQYFFSEEASRQPRRGETLAFLLVRPVKEQGSFTAAQKSVAALRGVVDAVRPQYPELRLGLTGLPVLENDEMTAAEHDTKLASWLAIAGVLLLFVIVYRSIGYPLLTVVTLLTGTVWAMGWMTLTVGHLNILSATFAVMLIGMGDYGVLWVMRYEQARRLGADVPAALKHTAIHVAVSNLTAASTLALAFFAAMLADFQAVAELGWIAGCGVLLCAFACFTVLPALLLVFDRRQQPLAVAIPISTQAGWLPRLTARPGWVIAGGLAVTACLAFFAGRVSYDHNLLHLQARDLDSVKWELRLIEKTAGASWHGLSYTSTPEQALALKERYTRLPEVSRVVEVASLVPADQDRKLEQLRDIQQRLRRLPEPGTVGRLVDTFIPDLLGLGNLSRGLDQLDERLDPQTLPNAPALLRELRDGVREVRAELKRRPPVSVARQLHAFEQHMAGDLAVDLRQLRDVSTPEAITLADLPPEFRERYVGRSGKWLLRVFARNCLWEFEPLEKFARQIQTVDPEATGKPFATVEGLKAMKSGFEWAGLYAFLVIVVVLAADFRSLRNTLLALAPLGMGLVMSLGIMGLCGLALNPANVIAFPLILGVGVDNGVHVLHDYLLRRRCGRSTISYPIGRGVLVKALTSMIGFGTLMLSSERGLAGLGFSLTLGVGCCMLTALVFLPALLRLLGGRVVLPVQAPEADQRLAA